MISKTEAQNLVTHYQLTIKQRVDALLRANASTGVLGATFLYTALDNNAQALAAKADLEALGWNVAIDAPNKTVTIS